MTGEFPSAPGIYLIRCKVTGDTYVGQTSDIKVRIGAHRCCLLAGGHANKGLQRLAIAHGVHSLVPSVLEVCKLIELSAREAHWFDKIRPTLNRLSPPGRSKSRHRPPRYLIQMTEGHRKKLDFLAVDAGATSSEEYGGRLLADTIDRLWERFDPKRADATRKAGGK